MEHAHCVGCITTARITEMFADHAAMARRTAALVSVSTLSFACIDADGRYRICYKGVATRYGVLPRYEGGPLDAP